MVALIQAEALAAWTAFAGWVNGAVRLELHWEYFGTFLPCAPVVSGILSVPHCLSCRALLCNTRAVDWASVAMIGDRLLLLERVPAHEPSGFILYREQMERVSPSLPAPRHPSSACLASSCYAHHNGYQLLPVTCVDVSRESCAARTPPPLSLHSRSAPCALMTPTRLKPR